jgi:hypothetical protein
MHCTIVISTPFMHTLDCDLAEPESEIQEEQSSCEYGGPQTSSCKEANIFSEQGKHQCIPPIFFGFSF